jgi:competence protein ComEC
VLRVSNAVGSVLLTGDIGQRVEQRLVEQVPVDLQTDVVLAPHHGSNSSSGSPFVDATAPRFVVYSAGWSNRYGFPVAAVRERWQRAGAVPLNTAQLGTVSFHFPVAGGLDYPTSYRLANRRFWHHLPPVRP